MTKDKKYQRRPVQSEKDRKEPVRHICSRAHQVRKGQYLVPYEEKEPSDLEEQRESDELRSQQRNRITRGSVSLRADDDGVQESSGN